MQDSPAEDKWIVVIGVFKLVKAALLVAAGIGIFKLLHKDIGEVLEHWVEVLRIDPDNRYVYGFVAKVLSLDSGKLKAIGAGTFGYAAMFFTEGAGLLLRKRWAQYFTIIVTGSFLPIEIYELVHRVSVAKTLAIIINIAIVVYFIFRLRGESRGPASGI